MIPYILPAQPHHECVLGTLSLVQVTKLRLREGKWLTQDEGSGRIQASPSKSMLLLATWSSCPGHRPRDPAFPTLPRLSKVKM